jgi:ribosome-binding protein aMBF1 (putative translation factor)
MIKEQQESFYRAVGKALTIARTHRNMSIAALATKSGEQHKTIRSIEAGNVCSLHHTVWMKSILGLELTKIIKGDSCDDKSEGFDSLI